jgi:hypothetical protein
MSRYELTHTPDGQLQIEKPPHGIWRDWLGLCLWLAFAVWFFWGAIGSLSKWLVVDGRISPSTVIVLVFMVAIPILVVRGSMRWNGGWRPANYVFDRNADLITRNGQPFARLSELQQVEIGHSRARGVIYLWLGFTDGRRVPIDSQSFATRYIERLGQEISEYAGVPIARVNAPAFGF